MILPEDTKAPLSDDEYDSTDYGVDDEAGVPFVPAPAGAIVYGHSADDHDGGESQPFLSTSGRDIELAIYPPPYSRRAGSPPSPVQKPPVRSLRDRLRDAPRIGIALAVLFVFYLFTHPPHPGRGPGRRPRPGPDGGFDFDGGPGGGSGAGGNGRPHRPPGDHRPPLHDEDQPMQYGRAVECAVFVDSMSGAQRTAEATFAIPLQADELFLALRGPADVGGVQVDAYDFVDYDSFPEGTTMFTNETLPNTDLRGPPVLVTVRGEYAAPETGAADAANSPGWAMLTGSRVCLMLHDNAASPQYEAVDSPGGPPGRGLGRHQGGSDNRLTFGKSGGVRLGVDVSSQGVTKGLHSPLNFKVQVLLPRSNSTTSTTAAAAPPPRSAGRRSRERGRGGPSSDPNAGPGLFDALLGASSPATARPQMPDGLVPPLTVRSDEGDVRVGNLSGVAMAGIEVRAQVGDVDIEHVRAEIVHIKTVGNIRVNASVSHSVEIVTPAGSIDLDLSLARSPAHRFFRWESELFPNRHPRPSSSHPDTASIKNFDASDPECLLQPVSAMIKGNHDHTIVRHSDWEVPCRQLHERVHAMVGNIEVYPHPLYEGPLHMSTSKGDISVEVSDVADPSGAGRKRTLNIDKAEHHGVKQYHGSIEWTSPRREQDRRAQEEEEEEEEDAEWPEEYADDDKEGLSGLEPEGRSPGDGPGGPGGPGGQGGHDDRPDGPPSDRSKNEPSGPHAPQDRRPSPPPWVARKAGLTFETSVGDISVVF